MFLSDIWDKDSNNLKHETDILRLLTDKRNWLAEMYVLRSALNQYKGQIVNPENTAKQSIRFYKLELLDAKGNPLHSPLKLKQIQQVFCVKVNTLKCEDKWNKSLNVTLNWRNIWSIVHKTPASAQAKQLQFRINHQIIFTEQKLQLMKISDGICTFCKSEKETLKHLFWECINAQSIWKILMPQFEKYSVNVLQRDIPNHELTALLGCPLLNKKAFVLNAIIFETKWHIWKNRNTVKFGKPALKSSNIIGNIKKTIYDRMSSVRNSYLLELYEYYFIHQ